MGNILRMRRSLLVGAALCASPALAQQTSVEAPPAPPPPASVEAPPATPDTPPATTDTPPAGQDVVVTGSRIRTPDLRSPNPLVSVSAAQLEQSGQTNLTSYLVRVPALTNSLDSPRTAGNAQPDGAIGQVGLNLLDLRGLGANRTLVLVDGRRHVAGQADSAAVDVNAIPIDLVQRVDVLTGAVSAVYGADGVSGVVNFIMQRDFDGVKARAQAGISERGDAGSRLASIVAGHNFAGGRANLTLAYEYAASDPLANDDRDYLRLNRRQYFVNLDNYTPGQPGSYQVGPVGDLRYPYGSNQGYVVIGDQVYRGDGAIYTPGRFLQNDAYSVGGDDTPVAGYIGDILPRTRRHAINLLGRYDASDAFQLKVEGKFVDSRATSFSGFGGDYPATISLDNPFVPLSIRQAALAAGQTTVDISRNNFDIPRRGESDRRRTWRGVIDAGGQLGDHARYDVSYTYGRTDIRATKLNDRLNDRFSAALDVVTDPATGRPVCRSNLFPGQVPVPATTFTPGPSSGCVPVNLFGGTTVDPASFGFYLFNPVSNARVTQSVLSGSVSGDFGQFLTLPGGPIRFAVGGEYRRETSRFTPASELTNNLFYQYDEYIIPTASRGSFNVREAFGELEATIVKDRPFASLLSVGAAGRHSRYSTIGKTNTYSFNAVYAPIADVTFRGSFGRSVRAPNIGEIFQPQGGTSAFFSDPCYVANRTSGTQYRQQNCQTLITSLGGNPANFTAANNPNAFIFIPGTSQGNPALKAETARTWTAGVVLRPRFVRNLEIGLDWYDIRLKGAINTPDANTVANLCVDQPSLQNAFCAAISREAGTGFINGFTVQPQNVAFFRTAGLELNAGYRVDLASLGRLDLRLVGGYLHTLEQIATPGAAVQNFVDTPFRPQWTASASPTWTIGKVTLAYNLSWQDGVRRFDRVLTDNNPTYVDPRYFRHSALWKHDVQLRFAPTRQMSFYLGVDNLTDQKPDIGFETNVPISPVGRSYYAGVRTNF